MSAVHARGSQLSHASDDQLVSAGATETFHHDTSEMPRASSMLPFSSCADIWTRRAYPVAVGTKLTFSWSTSQGPVTSGGARGGSACRMATATANAQRTSAAASSPSTTAFGESSTRWRAAHALKNAARRSYRLL